MGKISILVGNTADNQKWGKKVGEELVLAGHEVTYYPFAGNDYPEQMNTLLHASSDWIIAYGLDILSVTMTGGDYYINKFTEPVLILLDQPLREKLTLLEKRMNVTILFYSTIAEDVTAIRSLPHPLFCGLVSDYNDTNALLERAKKDLYEDI